MQVGGSWPKRSLTQVELGRAGGGEANPSPSPSCELVVEILRPKPWVVFFRLHHAGDEAIESRAGNFSNVGGYRTSFHSDSVMQAGNCQHAGQSDWCNILP